jgi:hypothetical protein
MTTRDRLEPMWRKSFVATAVAVGHGIDEAVATIDTLDPEASALVEQLRAPQRHTRATALAKAVHDIALAIDESTLR